MKLYISSLETKIPLDNSFVSLISISDVHFFSIIVRSLYATCKGIEPEIPVFFIDQNEKQNEISCEIILNPLSIDFSKKCFMNALVNKLREEMNNDEEYSMEIVQCLTEVQERIVRQLDSFDLPLKYDFLWDASKMIKGLSISIENETESLSQLDILLRYIRIAGDLKIARYHILIGLNNYLTKEELNIFYKEALQHQVKIICVEQSFVPPIENEYVFSLYIDEDYDEEIRYPKQSKTQFL